MAAWPHHPPQDILAVDLSDAMLAHMKERYSPKSTLGNDIGASRASPHIGCCSPSDALPSPCGLPCHHITASEEC